MITSCDNCGGLKSDRSEPIAGRLCSCPERLAGISATDLWEIHDLAQHVLKSRQNVGRSMLEQAQKVVAIVNRINARK